MGGSSYSLTTEFLGGFIAEIKEEKLPEMASTTGWTFEVRQTEGKTHGEGQRNVV
jgi:hypothetical protein